MRPDVLLYSLILATMLGQFPPANDNALGVMILEGSRCRRRS